MAQMNDEATRITLTLRPVEVWRFFVQNLLSRGTMLIGIAVIGVVWGFLLLSFVNQHGYRPKNWPEFIALVLFCWTTAAASFAGLICLFLAFRAWCPIDPMVYHEATIIVTNDFVRDETARGHSETRWAYVRFRQQGNGLHLYIRPHMAYILPRRAFASESDWQWFCGYCRARASA
jgi:hypothetical protein